SLGAPSVSPGPTLFTTSIDLTIAIPVGATARYTLDGTPVLRASRTWPISGTLTLTVGALLRVRFFLDAKISPEWIGAYLNGAGGSVCAAVQINVVSGTQHHG